LAAQHMIDDELERPRFQQVEAGDEKDLNERPGEAAPIGAQVGQEFPGEIAHRRDDRCQAARGASTGVAASPAGATGVSSTCFATVSMMPCISRPNSTVR